MVKRIKGIARKRRPSGEAAGDSSTSSSRPRSRLLANGLMSRVTPPANRSTSNAFAANSRSLIGRCPTAAPLVYLDSAASAQKPRRVIEKETECYERYYANALSRRLPVRRPRRRGTGSDAGQGPRLHRCGRAGRNPLHLGHDDVDQPRRPGWGRKFLESGDEILLTQMEHHANLVPWQQSPARKGPSCGLSGSAGRSARSDHLDELFTDRTRIVAITGMSNVLGTVPPIAEIGKRAKAHGALVLVDGARACRTWRPTSARCSIDFLAFSGHKLYGPTGIGVLYGRRTLLEAMDPFLCGGHMIGEVFWDHSTWAGLPAKFEAGTIPIAQAIALGSAVDFVSEIGFPAIHAHEHDLTAYAFQRLSEIPGLTIYGPEPPHRGPIVSFRRGDSSARSREPCRP